MEEQSLKKYLYEMNRVIRSGNPRFMSYVSREYMKYQITCPAISEAIRDMIVKEKNRNTKSPYAVFLDSDGSVSLESMSSISKISNVAQFISQVQELSKYNVNFENMTADDLIIESDRIAEELEKEAESNLEENDDVSKGIDKAEDSLAKLSIFAAVGGVIGSRFRNAISRIKEKISGAKKKKDLEPKEKKRESNQIKRNSFEDVCPKVNIDEIDVINNMKKVQQKEITKNADTYGDGDPDGDDISL